MRDPDNTTPPAGTRTPYRLALAVACLLINVGLDLVLRSLALPESRIIPWYPPAGLAFAALVLAGPIAALPLFVARIALVLTYWAQPAPLWATLGEAALLVAAYTSGAEFVRRNLPADGRTWGTQDAARLSAALLGAAVASGTVAAATTSTWRGQPWSSFWSNTLQFAAGDAAGTFVIVPVALLVLAPWNAHRRMRQKRVLDVARTVPLATQSGAPAPSSRTPERRRTEHLAQGLATLAVILLGVSEHQRSGLSTSLLCFAPVIWVSLREGVRGAALVMAAYGIGCAVMGLWLGITLEQVQYYQALLIVLGLTGLFVGAVRTSAVESDALYWHLVATANEAIWRLDPNGKTIHVNNRLGALLGAEPAELMGRRALDFLAPEEHQHWLDERARREDGEDGLYETTIIRTDGTRRRVLVSASQMRSATSGGVLGSVAMITDITPLREAERQRTEAQQSEERAQVLLEAAFRSAGNGMVLFRASDEVIIDVNDEWCRITGYSRENAVGRSQKDLDIWADPGDAERVAQTIAEHGAVQGMEISFHRHLPDGSVETGTALLSAQPARLGDTLYFLVSGQDITDEKRVAQHRSQLQRLEELGRLAGGVAHDFNNLLTVVHSYAQIIRHCVVAGEPVEVTDAAEIERAADRGRALTSRLLAFSRNQSVEVKPVDLNAVLRAADGMLRPLLGSAVQIDYDLAPRLPMILADTGQLDQVLLNFAVNARDAMGEEGRLTLTTRVAVVAPGEVGVVVGPDALPGEYVILEVTDTGEGMDDAIRARIFEPFFSTKGPGRGTGLGLAVVFGIVRQAHGAIKVRSALGRGTTFTIYWPTVSRSTDAVRAGATPDATRARSDRTASILLVDDENALRTVVRRALERDGYRVTEARDGRDALERLETMLRDGEAVDLVLSDVVMPRMNGLELADQIAEHHPAVRVVLMSGYTDERSRGNAPANGGLPMVGKPFDLAVLLGAVRTALASPSGVLAPLAVRVRR